MLFAAVAMVVVGCSAAQSPPAASKGATGSAGSVMLDRWISFREFMFDENRSDMQAGDSSKIGEIAVYMNANPSLQIGIDGSMDPQGSDPRDQSLSDRRVGAVRDALIQAGVPSYKIQTGPFGDAQLARDRRVEVLFSTMK